MRVCRDDICGGRAIIRGRDMTVKSVVAADNQWRGRKRDRSPFFCQRTGRESVTFEME